MKILIIDREYKLKTIYEASKQMVTGISWW